MEMKYLKDAARLLNRDYVNRRGLDLSIDLLCVSVGQKAAELPAIKIGGLKKNSADRPSAGKVDSNRADRPKALLLFDPETHSTSIERSKPLLLTQSLSKSLEALLMYFISVQISLISIGLISKGAVFVGPICR